MKFTDLFVRSVPYCRRSSALILVLACGLFTAPDYAVSRQRRNATIIAVRLLRCRRANRRGLHHAAPWSRPDLPGAGKSTTCLLE